MHLSPHTVKAPLLAGLLVLACAARASSPLPPLPPLPSAMDEAVELTGWLHVDDLGFEQTDVQLQMNGASYYVPVSRTGRVDVALPVGVEAVLHFSHPGHVAKEITIDTRFAQAGEFAKHLRHIQFAVILEKDYFHEGIAYAAPVGTMSFDEQGGCLAVAHDNKIVVGRRSQSVTF